MKVEFDWDKFRELESTLSPIEENVIRDHFRQMVEGNSDMEEYDDTERHVAAQQFRLGWLSARLAMKAHS